MRAPAPGACAAPRARENVRVHVCTAARVVWLCCVSCAAHVQDVCDCVRVCAEYVYSFAGYVCMCVLCVAAR